VAEDEVAAPENLGERACAKAVEWHRFGLSVVVCYFKIFVVHFCFARGVRLVDLENLGLMLETCHVRTAANDHVITID
jgi:hypothetical protein